MAEPSLTRVRPPFGKPWKRHEAPPSHSWARLSPRLPWSSALPKLKEEQGPSAQLADDAGVIRRGYPGSLEHVASGAAAVWRLGLTQSMC